MLKNVELLGKHRSVKDFPSNWLPLVKIITSNEVSTAIKNQSIKFCNYNQIVTIFIRCILGLKLTNQCEDLCIMFHHKS